MVNRSLAKQFKVINNESTVSCALNIVLTKSSMHKHVFTLGFLQRISILNSINGTGIELLTKLHFEDGYWPKIIFSGRSKLLYLFQICSMLIVSIPTTKFNVFSLVFLRIVNSMIQFGLNSKYNYHHSLNSFFQNGLSFEFSTCTLYVAQKLYN